MATISKVFLSGSTNGKQIKVAATATAGTLIHTAIAGTSDIDEIWVYVTNSDTVDRLVTLEWGGVASPDDLIQFTVPAKDGIFWIARGLPLQNGLVVRAFAAVTNVLLVGGFVNRITA